MLSNASPLVFFCVKGRREETNIALFLAWLEEELETGRCMPRSPPRSTFSRRGSSGLIGGLGQDRNLARRRQTAPRYKTHRAPKGGPKSRIAAPVMHGPISRFLRASEADFESELTFPPALLSANHRSFGEASMRAPARSGLDATVPRLRFLRGPTTWHCYLLFGFFAYLLNIQGNVLPFLKSELGLNFSTLSLHSSAVALGLLAVGLFGDRFRRRFGRARALWLAVGGMTTGAIMLCLASAAWASIASCPVIGSFGGLIPSIVPAILSDIHQESRDTAFAEATAISNGVGMLAPLMTGLFIWLALGWRYAVIVGAVFGCILLLGFRRISVTDLAGRHWGEQQRLPISYWAYWVLGAAAVSLEFSVLLWAPAFSRGVAGFSVAWAASIAAGFPLGIMLSRLSAGFLVRMIPAEHVFMSALFVTLIGFALYWGIDSTSQPRWLAFSSSASGLGRPLSLSGSPVGATPSATNAATSRMMVAVGMAILVAPDDPGKLGGRGRASPCAPNGAGVGAGRSRQLPHCRSDEAECPACSQTLKMRVRSGSDPGPIIQDRGSLYPRSSPVWSLALEGIAHGARR